MQLQRLQPCEGSADPKVKFHTSCHSVGLTLVEINRGAGSAKNVTVDPISTTFLKTKNREFHNARSLCVAEFGPLDLDVGIDRLCLRPDFGADMLAFAIAIGPDKQCFGISRLLLDIVRQTAIILSHSVLLSLNKVQRWLWMEELEPTSATCSTTGASNN